MALYTGLRLSHVFGKVLSQSGASFIDDMHSVMDDLVRHLPLPQIDIWMDVGRFDFILEGNRRMASLLRRKKYRVFYNEVSGGHNYTSWRDDISQGLEVAFG